MGFVALPPEGIGEFAPTVELGVGPAEIFVAAALIYTLAFAYLLDAARLDYDHHREMHGTLSAGAAALLLCFGAVVLYTSITVL